MKLRANWIGLAIFIATNFNAFASEPIIRSLAQTASMPGNGDVADDVCVWINPRDGARSVILGCNKSDGRSGGIYVFQLDGSRWKEPRKWRKDVNWFASGNKINNVVLFRGFRAGAEFWDLVVAANRTTRTLDLFRVRTDERGDFLRLENEGCIPIGAGFAEGDGAPYGLAAGSVDAGRCMIFVSDKSGRLAQFEIHYTNNVAGGNPISARRFDNGGQPWHISEGGEEIEGMVVDAKHNVVYIACEKEGIFRCQLQNGLLDIKSKMVVERISARLQADVEGLALYSRDDGSGYLLASAQGANAFVVYEREFDPEKPNERVGDFKIGKRNGIDAVEATDGIEASCADLGGALREGVFIAHDGKGESNYKVVPWSDIQPVLIR